MTTFGMPYFLEDQTGELTGSEFVDLYNRMRLSFRCTIRDAERASYVVYDMTNRGASRTGILVPLACLNFGANNALGTLKIGDGEYVNMNDYLSKTTALGSSRTRKFVASDGQEYQWTHTLNNDAEWTCLNSRGYHVASYSLKPAGEPQYSGSSGCVLTVEESHPHIIGDLLASLLIMRHIAKHNI
ncbi:hypothetical protein B0H21DRAFT_169546 [Amylocystis lapponica]|nr:hypothetical protein B0H21DRAFT_169546 [Amylocystis lapponica]